MNLQEQVSRIKQVMKLNESEDNKSEDYDLVFSLFDDFTRGANIYYNPETESIWMIFPEEKIWVFQLEKDGDLWYYYNFFVDVFKYLSLDVIDNQHYITEWVEDILKRRVKDTTSASVMRMWRVEDTLKRGVKDTLHKTFNYPRRVEDTLKRGVKQTSKGGFLSKPHVEDILKRGKKLNNDDELE